MSESIQPVHPGPDTLSAFIEGVLPEHERMQCMAHLADCAECREVVYLAQEPLETDPAPAPAKPESISFWKRWFRPIPALTFATAAGTILLSFSLYEHLKSIPKTPPVMAIATPQPPPEPAAAIPGEPQTPQVKPRVPKPAEPPAPKPVAPPPEKDNAPVATFSSRDSVSTAPVAAPPPPPQPQTIAPAAVPLVAAAPPPISPAKPAPQTGIAGTITDPAGGAIPNAVVKLRPLTSPASRDVTSDPKGQFNVAGLEPGPYEMQVIANGFKQTTKQIEVQPNQIAHVDSTLQLGSAAESVSVTAETTLVQTESNSRATLAGAAAGGRGGGGGGFGGRGGRGATGGRAALAKTQALPPSLDGVIDTTPLANKPPANTTITKGKVILTIDPAGALSLSQNAGKKWKTVKPAWRGKVIALLLLSASAPSDPSFQLTTDTGAIWLSRDGSHWYAAQK